MYPFRIVSCCLLIFSLALMHACTERSQYSETDLIKYLSSNERFFKTSTSGDITLRVTYRPTDLMVAQELRGIAHPTEQAITHARQKYDHHYYFIMSLSRSGKELLTPSATGMAQFSELLQTISFRMHEVVNMTTFGGDTIPVADYVYNRTFGLGSSTDLLFVFERTAAQDQEWVQLNINEFGLGIGRQFLRFRVTDLENAPDIYEVSPTAIAPSEGQNKTTNQLSF